MAKILIVDDSFFVRSVLKKYLEKHGHEIIGEADDGKIAIELYKQHSPDLVTLDVVMPNSGLVALEQILEYDENASIMLYTSIPQSHVIEKAIKTGAKCFLSKRVTGDVFLKAIHDILSQKRNDDLDESNPLTSGDFINNSKKSFFIAMFNDSMKDFGILENDIMILEKITEPKNDDLIMCMVDDQVVFGSYYKKEDETIIIKPGNILYNVIRKKEIETLGIIKGFVRIFHQKAPAPVKK